MSGYTPVNTAPESNHMIPGLSADSVQLGSLIASGFAFLVECPVLRINVVIDHASISKPSFWEGGSHRIRVTVLQSNVDGRAVESVLAQVIHEARGSTHSGSILRNFFTALKKTYSLLHPLVVEKMDYMDNMAGGQVRTRFKLVEGKLQDSAGMYKSKKSLND